MDDAQRWLVLLCHAGKTGMNLAKKLLLLLGIGLFSQATAQRVSHSIGVDVVFPGKGVETHATYIGMWYEKPTTKFTRIGIAYFPKFVLIAEKRMSFSIGMPISIGVAIPRTIIHASQPFSSMAPSPTYEKLNTKSGARFAIEIPLVADINFGAGATPKTGGKLGGYIGAGYAYNHLRFPPVSNKDKLESGLYQLYFHGGVRIHKPKIVLGITCRPKKDVPGEKRNTTWGLQVFRDL